VIGSVRVAFKQQGTVIAVAEEDLVFAVIRYACAAFIEFLGHHFAPACADTFVTHAVFHIPRLLFSG
jgi:hypothetical protein